MRNSKRSASVSEIALFRKAKVYAYKVMAGTHSSIYFVTRLLTLTVLVVGAWLSYQGQLTAGEFVSFVLFTNVLIKPVDKISALLEMYPKGMAGFRRFCDMLDEEPAIVDSKDAIAVERLQGDITFENVSFKYADSKPVLNNISFISCWKNGGVCWSFWIRKDDD